ncbi:metallophosphoesterase family protein [Enterococcus sp. LJL99]
MSKKIGLLADIHGNLTALEAVLEDAAQKEITEYWILGDLFLPGPSGREILDKLTAIAPTIWVRGNWDDCFLSVADKKVDLKNPEEVYIGILGAKIISEFKPVEIEFLQNLPIQLLKKSEELNFSITHNLLNKNYGGDLVPNAEQAMFDQLVENQVDISIYAHVHHQMLRYGSQDQLIINPGSIGQAFNGWKNFKHDQRAHYAILEINEMGNIDFDFRRITYDIQKELQRSKEVNLPFFELYQELLETGITHTHDRQLLEGIISRNGYREILKDFLDKE